MFERQWKWTSTPAVLRMWPLSRVGKILAQRYSLLGQVNVSIDVQQTQLYERSTMLPIYYYYYFQNSFPGVIQSIKLPERPRR